VKTPTSADHNHQPFELIEPIERFEPFFVSRKGRKGAKTQRENAATLNH
jgi:hypothetical protein